MIRHFARIIIAVLLLAGLGACNNVPDHANLIPRDALGVVGINTGKLGKQVAWSALAGSQLFKDMQHDMPANAMVNDLEDAGIRKMSVSYIYTKPGAMPGEGSQITALIPLNNKKKWEDYVHKVFPAAQVKDAGKRRETSLMDGVYAGWDNELLIVVAMMKATPENNVEMSVSGIDTIHADVLGGADSLPAATYVRTDTSTSFRSLLDKDATALAAKLSQAFEVKKDNALTGDRRFEKLQKEDHGISFWVNYEKLMEENKSKMQGMVALPATLWKDAAAAAGLDFEKGKIAGDLLYYSPEALREVSKQFGSISADKEMIERLPAGNMDMMLSAHLEPAGIKTMMDKMGMLGFINLALTGNGLSVDDILESFTGDIVFSLNGFRLQQTDTALNGHTGYKPSMDMLYSMKINNKEKFNKLFQMAVQQGLFTPGPSGSYLMKGSTSDSTLILKDDNYFVIGSSANATGFLQGSNKAAALPAPAQAVYNHPFGMYMDFQAILAGLSSGPSRADYSDSAALAEGRRVFNNMVVTGGDYKNNALTYHLDIGFVNKEENSLIQLMDFGMKMSQAKDREEQMKKASAQAALTASAKP